MIIRELYVYTTFNTMISTDVGDHIDEMGRGVHV